MLIGFHSDPWWALSGFLSRLDAMLERIEESLENLATHFHLHRD